jgi:hypothetical protein
MPCTAVLYAHHVQYLNTVDDTGGSVLEHLIPKALTAQSGE